MLNSYLVQLEKSRRSALILRQQRARGPQAALELQGQFKPCYLWLTEQTHSWLQSPAPWASLALGSSRVSLAEGNVFYHLHARRGFPTLRENPVCPFLGIFGWFSVSDYGAAGKLYVLNWKFWKPYSYLLASGWSLSTIFVMCCHVGAWSLGCELVPHSRKETVPTSTMQGSNTGMLWTEPQKLLTEKKLGTSR